MNQLKRLGRRAGKIFATKSLPLAMLLLTLTVFGTGSTASFADENKQLVPASVACAAADWDCKFAAMQAQFEGLIAKLSPIIDQSDNAEIEKTKLESQKLQLEVNQLTAKKQTDQKEDEQEARKRELELTKLGIEVQQLAREEEKNLAVEEEHLTYTFYAEVDEGTVADCTKKLGEMARRSPGKPITIVLDSPGGSVLDGFHLYGFIKELRRQGHKVTIVAFGMAASMGGVILQAADVRVVDSTTWILIHEVSGGAMGKISEMTDRVDWERRLWVQSSEILAQRSTMTAAQIREKANRTDWWVTAAEAKTLGFVDVVR